MRDENFFLRRGERDEKREKKRRCEFFSAKKANGRESLLKMMILM